VSVFLELFRKTEEANGHAEALARHASQLRRLADAAIAIHAAGSLEDLLKLVADAAASIIGAAQVGVAVEAPASVGVGRARPRRCAGLRPERSALDLLARRALADVPSRPVRISRAEMESQGHWSDVAGGGFEPLRGWLAVPLSSREGRSMGWIQLSD